MKKPNKLLNKKYLSSLVIAAFLLLSVLTAYNIRFGNKEPDTEKTEVEETIGGNEDVISSKEEDRESRQPEEKEEEEEGMDSQEEKESDPKDTSEEEERETAEKNFDYDGSSKMTWPVVGNIILPYSMDTTVYYTTLDQYACNDGILIGAKKGEEVVATADGRIVNIMDSDRYGTTLTLLIGEQYEVSYAQIDNVKYEVGDEVKEGDVLATVAKPTRSFTLEGPHLFFKMTYQGEPVNPTDYM